MSTVNSSDQYDVLVVGGGPCGLAASIALGRSGIKTLLVEKHPSTSFHPRGHVVNARTMEILRTWGLEEGVRARGIPHDLNQGVAFVRSVAGEQIGEIRTFSDKQRNRVIESYSPSAKTSCSQDLLEPVLRRGAEAELSVSAQFGTRLDSIEQDDEVRAQITGPDGNTRRVRARYAIAADGARGTLRDQLGIAMNGEASLGNQIGVYFECDLWPLVKNRPNLLWWIYNRSAVGVMIALDGRRRWTYNFGYNAQSNTPKDFTPERCAGIIKSAIGDSSFEPVVRDIRVWQMQARIAQTLRAGRIFLAGDAAHPLPPTGGQGMNTAVGDVHNLGWKLALVIKGLASAELLDTYEQERMPIIRFNVAQSVRNARKMEEAGLGGIMRTHEDFREEDIERMREAIPYQREHFDYYGQTFGYAYRSNAILDEGNDPTPKEINTYAATKAPGGRAPHCWLSWPGGVMVSTIDLFKDLRFTLLAGRDGHEWTSAFRRVSADAGLDGHAYTVGPDAELIDHQGTFHEVYEISPEGAVLVRPDGHVVWRSHGTHPSPIACINEALSVAVSKAQSTALEAA